MSRYYSAEVEIENYEPSYEEAIIQAADEEWDFEDWKAQSAPGLPGGAKLRAFGESYLTGGESPDAFAERMAKAIWRANNRYCRVEVVTTCLENLPYDKRAFSEADYDSILAGELED